MPAGVVSDEKQKPPVGRYFSASVSIWIEDVGLVALGGVAPLLERGVAAGGNSRSKVERSQPCSATRRSQSRPATVDEKLLR